MWIKATQASVAANGTLITINSGESMQSVQPGDAAILAGNAPVEIAAVQQDGSGRWQLVLGDPWAATAVTNGALRVQPNGGRFEAAIQAMRDINTYAVNTHAAMNDWLTSSANTISVETSDGSSVSIPTLSNYRSNWGTAAERDVGTAAGNLMEVGAFGIGAMSIYRDIAEGEPNLVNRGGGFSNSHSAVDAPSGVYSSEFFRGSILTIPSDNPGIFHKLWFVRGDYVLYPRMFIASVANDTVHQFIEFLTNANTTVDSNGFLKSASPIVKLHADHLETNELAEGATLTKNGIGDYTVAGTLGFAQEGWYIETPKDANNNIKVFVDYQQVDDGAGHPLLHIRTYQPDYADGPVQAGEPVDIPAGRFITLRCHELNNSEATSESMAESD